MKRAERPHFPRLITEKRFSRAFAEPAIQKTQTIHAAEIAQARASACCKNIFRRAKCVPVCR